jgi:hypothetical protein
MTDDFLGICYNLSGTWKQNCILLATRLLFVHTLDFSVKVKLTLGFTEKNAPKTYRVVEV